MKKLFAFLFASLMILSLAACGSKPVEPAPVPDEAPSIPIESSSEPEPEPEPAIPAPDITIGACIYKFDDTFMGKVRNSMEVQAEKLGVNLKIVDSQNKQPTQNEQVDAFIAEGVDALIINPVDLTRAGPIIDKAAEADIPIVLMNRQPFEEDMAKYDRAWYVGAREEEAYAISGQIIINYFIAHPDADKNKDGTIQYIMLEGEPGRADYTDTLFRRERRIQWIRDNCAFDLDELACDIAMWDKIKATDLMKSFIASQGLDKIEAVFADNDDMALGAIDALKAEGYNTGDASKYIPVVGIDATAPALESMSKGELLGTVLNDYENQGIATVNTAVAAVQWSKVNKNRIGYEITDDSDPYDSCRYVPSDDFPGKYVWIPYVKVTADNYQDFM